MTTIATFDSPEEAYLFRAFLGSREVEAFIWGEHLAQLFWTHRIAFGGVRVVIHDEDWDEAATARGEYFAAINEPPSLVTEVRNWPLVLVISLFVGGPLPLWGRKAVGIRRTPQSTSPLADPSDREPRP